MTKKIYLICALSLSIINSTFAMEEELIATQPMDESEDMDCSEDNTSSSASTDNTLAKLENAIQSENHSLTSECLLTGITFTDEKLDSYIFGFIQRKQGGAISWKPAGEGFPKTNAFAAYLETRNQKINEEAATLKAFVKSQQIRFPQIKDDILATTPLPLSVIKLILDYQP